jgi:hypothetical protein
MKIEKRLLAFVGLGGLAAVACWLLVTLLPDKRKAIAKQIDSDHNKATVTAIEAQSPVEETRPPSDRTDPLKIFEAIEATNVSITFWGKVVDQDGLPVSGVTVRYDYTVEHGNLSGVAWSNQEERTGETVSGPDGVFSVLGLKAHNLGILSVKHPDYQYRGKEALSFDYYGSTASGKFVSDRRKPVIFTIVQKQRLEPLIHTKGRLSVPGDGTPERWNLWSGETDPSGELALIFRADPGVSATPAQLVNWSAELKVAEGGITEAPWDEDVRRAPESGYSASVVYPKVNQKQGVPHRSFYLRTADGKYGRIQVEISTSHDGRTARCFITADMNPRPGSRNLEPSEE